MCYLFLEFFLMKTNPKHTSHPRLLLGGLFSGLLVMALTNISVSAPASEQELVNRMRAGGVVLMIRHAIAPGTGDPADFRLGDCTTQRNLSEAGREQSRSIGAWLRRRGIEHARVYSSQWCRCLETARLINLGEVTPLPALNSFFERPQDREPNLSALSTFLAKNNLQGEVLVLVTHQVTVSAITNEFTASGHGVLLTVGDDGAVPVLGKLAFGE
jgi:phosphohistidine phosphatase SixA